jgi:hypothetical protein
MAHWDDIDPEATLRLYDKGLEEPPHYDSFGEFHYLLRNADVHLPAIRQSEPLVNQAEAFLDWVLDGTPRGPDAANGWAVAKILEAAMRSIKNGGAMCPVDLDAAEVCTEASRSVREVMTRFDVPSAPVKGFVGGEPVHAPVG